MSTGRHGFRQLFTVPRNRRAVLASVIVMFMQQFCGVNVIAYYSTNVFLQAGFTQQSAFLASFGWGAINWLFALPAIWTIDTFGRRNLLLFTFPFMALFMFLAGFAFWIPETGNARVAVVTLAMYLFSECLEIIQVSSEAEFNLVRLCLLTWRRTCAVHVLCGGLPSVPP